MLDVGYILIVPNAKAKSRGLGYCFAHQFGCFCVTGFAETDFAHFQNQKEGAETSRLVRFAVLTARHFGVAVRAEVENLF